MADISAEAKKEIEKMALKATEKLMDIAVDNFKENLKSARMSLDIATGLHARAVHQHLDSIGQQPTKTPE